MTPRPHPVLPSLVGGSLALLLLVQPVASEAQTASVRAVENLRTEPNGVLIGQVMAGTELRAPRVEDRWVEVVLEGWVWTRSLQRLEGEAMDLVVSAEDGENLREAPSGRIAARLGRGTQLAEVDRVPGWIRVRRSAWVWSASLEMAGGPPAGAASPARGDAPAAGASSGATPARPGAAAADPTPATGAAAPPGRWLRTGDEGAAILVAPDGDAVGTSAAGTELRVLAREGEWARVQLEGWVRVPAMASPVEEGDGAVASGVRPADMAREPERYRGRLVELELQFVSLERAEAVRTDFAEGEPFLLTRAAEGGGFVYVALPHDRLQEVRGFLPLERISVIGRVRTGAAGFTGSPILDLVEVRRVGARSP